MKKSIIASTLILTSTLTFAFDLGAIAKGVVDNVVKEQTTTTSNSTTQNKSTTTANTNLSDSTVSSGLKEALKTGVKYAVTQLGSNNGYLNNQAVKIPLPDNLAKAETIIRSAGGSKMADDLIASMNSAATKAAPQTAEIFMNAIDKMSVTDAQAILTGGNEAATNYFKSNTTDSLKKLITPIIQETMKENQVASYYDTVNNLYKSSAKGLVENSSVMSLAKGFGVDSYIPTSSDQSLDEFVTNKAIEGLFTMIGEKEAAIRANPVEQTTSILKQVFGK
jgi:transcriptional regulator with PAS, ATPase and Fis domain